MSFTRAAVIALLLPCIACTSTALAQVTLPDGQVVPRDSLNGETQLYTLFSGRGEPIDWVNDASAAPDTFSPLCGFSAELLLKESGSNLGVGWYNVVPGAAAAPNPLTEIFPILLPPVMVGSQVAGATIRDDPNYLGGAIGFALIRTPPHYSEARWNTYCNQGGCSATPGHWIMSVSYQSSLVDSAYYLAFEDGNTTNSGWSNDGDYNDYVFLFTGIACVGAGEPCEVEGGLGVCAAGLTECDGLGVLGCRAVNAPGAEVCDGVDNDCDGEVDTGDDVCPEFQACIAGNCVPSCGDEFPCLYGDVCEDDRCVNPACVGVTCPDGQACRGGSCRAPCDGVVCPGEQVCRVGRCVEACAGVDCGAGRVCQAGVCVLPCSCQGCAEGLSCDAVSERCVDPGCDSVGCGGGEVCRAGACQDACVDAVCPDGERCQAGQCVTDTGGGDGGAPAQGADAGVPVAGGDAFGSGGAWAQGGGLGAGTGGGASRNRRPDDAGGCGCRVAGRRMGDGPGSLGWLLALVLWGRRRRRTPRDSGQRSRVAP